MSFARDERTALCALLDETGPDAPTLCEGWRTRHLAAHLVLRERRPDLAAGIPGGPLAARTRRATESLATGTPFARLVEQIRTGPPALSPFRLRSVEERINLLEFFVHHEDVRRGNGEWEPRTMGDGLADALWLRLRMGRLLFRKAPVGVELVRDDLVATPGPSGGGREAGAGAKRGGGAGRARGRDKQGAGAGTATAGADDRQGQDAGGHGHRPPGGTDPVGAWPHLGRPGPPRRHRGRGPQARRDRHQAITRSTG